MRWVGSVWDRELVARRCHECIGCVEAVVCSSLCRDLSSHKMCVLVISCNILKQEMHCGRPGAGQRWSTWTLRAGASQERAASACRNGSGDAPLPRPLVPAGLLPRNRARHAAVGGCRGGGAMRQTALLPPLPPSIVMLPEAGEGSPMFWPTYVG